MKPNTINGKAWVVVVRNVELVRVWKEAETKYKITG